MGVGRLEMSVVGISPSGPGASSTQVRGVGDDTGGSDEVMGWVCCGMGD